jgi:hypothetical protein
MSDKTCTYPGSREEALVAYAYGEVAECDVCRNELREFALVRGQLAEWTPPEPTRAIAQPRDSSVRPSVSSKLWGPLHGMPVWAQFAAAMLVLGVAAGVANLQIRYGTDGLSIRTGYGGQTPTANRVLTPDTSSVNRAPTPSADQPPPAAPVAPPVTRAELVALERVLRQEIEAANGADPGVLREVRALVAASERRQENELALRIGTMAQDLRAQREADNAMLSRWVGSFRNSTDREAMRTREMISSLAVKVSQR